MRKGELLLSKAVLAGGCAMLMAASALAGDGVSRPDAISAFVDTERHSEQEQRNLRTAWQFYNAALNEKNWEKARGYMGDVFDQHSIYAEDQHKGLKDLVAFLGREYPQNRGELKRAFAAGDMVVMHLHVTRYRGHQGWSVIELVRVENDKVVEHWDMFQTVADESANDNGMF